MLLSLVNGIFFTVVLTENGLFSLLKQQVLLKLPELQAHAHFE